MCTPPPPIEMQHERLPVKEVIVIRSEDELLPEALQQLHEETGCLVVYIPDEDSTLDMLDAEQMREQGWVKSEHLDIALWLHAELKHRLVLGMW